MKSLLISALLILFTTNVAAATLQQQISKHIQDTTKMLNKTSQDNATNLDYYKFTLNSQKVISADLNNDGIKDKIAVLDYCEKSNCHPTTMSTEIAVFIGKNQKNFYYIGSSFFEVSASVNNVRNGNINVHQYDFSEDDAHCCPSRLTKFNLFFKGGKLASKKII